MTALTMTALGVIFVAIGEIILALVVQKLIRNTRHCLKLINLLGKVVEVHTNSIIIIGEILERNKR